MFLVFVHLRTEHLFPLLEANADGPPSTADGKSNDSYESKVGMRHWSVNQTTIPGLLMDLYDNGGSTQLSGEEIAETVLDLLRRL